MLEKEILSSNLSAIITNLLIKNKGFYAKWNSQVDHKNLPDEYSVIVKTIKEYFGKYSSLPSMSIIRDEVLKKYKSDRFKNFKLLLKKTFKKIKDIKSEEVLNYAESEIIDYLNVEKVKSAAPKILEELSLDRKKALKLFRDTYNSFTKVEEDKIVNFFDKDEISRRIDYSISDKREMDAIGTLIITLDKVLRNNGLDRKTLTCITASYNVGKTTIMVYLGKAAVMQGFKVLFITCQESKEDIAYRFDSSFTNISINKLANQPKRYQRRILDAASQFNKNLFILWSPAGDMNINDISLYYEYLKMEYGFEADMIECDALDDLNSNYFIRDDNERIKSIWKDARAFAQKKNIVFLSSNWTNREEMKLIQSGEKEFFTGSGTQSTIKKMDICDLHLTINPAYDSDNEDEDKKKSSGKQDVVIFIDKNRMGPRYITFPMTVNYEKNSIYWKPASYRKYNPNYWNRKKQKKD